MVSSSYVLGPPYARGCMSGLAADTRLGGFLTCLLPELSLSENVCGCVVGAAGYVFAFDVAQYDLSVELLGDSRCQWICMRGTRGEIRRKNHLHSSGPELIISMHRQHRTACEAHHPLSHAAKAWSDGLREQAPTVRRDDDAADVVSRGYLANLHRRDAERAHTTFEQWAELAESLQQRGGAILGRSISVTCEGLVCIWFCVGYTSSVM